MIKNAKSPLLDGLLTATFPMAGVTQDDLARLIRVADCKLIDSIEINQKNINTIYFSQLKKSDALLKKLSRSVKKITSVEEFQGFISSLEDEEDQEFEHSEVPQEVYQFDFIKELVEDEKRNIKNLLMTSQVQRKKQAEVIYKSAQ